MSQMRLPSAISSHEDHEACGACVNRRDFFEVGLGLAALALLSGVVPRGAAAASVGWTRAAARGGTLRYPTPAADGVQVDREHELIIVRQGSRLVAFALSCPHQRSMLRWREDDGIFQCTKHRSEYRPSGEYIKGRATRNMDRLAVSVEGTELVVDPSVVFKSDEDPRGWESAVATLP